MNVLNNTDTVDWEHKKEGRPDNSIETAFACTDDYFSNQNL